jgi:hypothetical protein
LCYLKRLHLQSNECANIFISIQFFQDFPLQTGFGILTRTDLPSWEFPFVGHLHACPALGRHDQAVSFDNGSADVGVFIHET